MEGRIESAGGDEFCFRETEGETNSPTGRAAGRGSRSAETAIVKVRKSGKEPQTGFRSFTLAGGVDLAYSYCRVDVIGIPIYV